MLKYLYKDLERKRRKEEKISLYIRSRKKKEKWKTHETMYRRQTTISS
jgi:hypothetical protein